MGERMFNTRIQNKHDIEANWNEILDFTPKIGELIVYDPDENYTYARIKIGDGVNTIGNLPFVIVPITNEEIDEICAGSIINAGEVLL